jgi:hypothetical protein
MIETVKDGILYSGFIDKHDISMPTIQKYAKQLLTPRPMKNDE